MILDVVNVLLLQSSFAPAVSKRKFAVRIVFLVVVAFVSHFQAFSCFIYVSCSRFLSFHFSFFSHEEFFCGFKLFLESNEKLWFMFTAKRLSIFSRLIESFLHNTRRSLVDWQKHVSKKEFYDTHKTKKNRKLRASTNGIKRQEKDFQWENKLEFRTRRRRKKLQNEFFSIFFSHSTSRKHFRRRTKGVC